MDKAVVFQAIGWCCRKYWAVIALSFGLTLIVAVEQVVDSQAFELTLNEMLIRITVAVGIYIFIGNSGVLSFGHTGFMCIGAYAAAWATCDPTWKQIMLTGLPALLINARYPFLLAVAGAGGLAAVVSLVFGLAVVRLSGIAASIATFAFLAIVNNVYSNWDSVTGGTSSIVGIPTVSSPWVFLAFALFGIFAAFLFQESRFGVMLRASRDDEIAAKASAVNVPRTRLIAFVLSALFVGIGGGLYAHFLGVLTVNVFYMDLTFVVLSMLIVGGMASLTGAVVGVVSVTAIVEVLRAFETSVPVMGHLLQLPKGSQEIGLGLVLGLVLVFRPGGLTRGREVPFPAKWLTVLLRSPAWGTRHLPLRRHAKPTLSIEENLTANPKQWR